MCQETAIIKVNPGVAPVAAVTFLHDTGLFCIFTSSPLFYDLKYLKYSLNSFFFFLKKKNVT
jgi:hypothetical protein